MDKLASASVPSALAALSTAVWFAGTTAATGRAVVARTCMAAAGAGCGAGTGAGAAVVLFMTTAIVNRGMPFALSAQQQMTYLGVQPS